MTQNGTVFVAWRQFEFRPEQGQSQRDAVAWVKSTNGGRRFTKPAIATEFIGWDLTDQTGSPAANGQARYDACLAGDGTLGGCASPEPRVTARDCGDGPLVCQSGYVFFRADTQVRITADPTALGNPNEAFVVYDGSVPDTETPTGTTYGTRGSGTGSQASIYFLKTSDGGSWSTPIRIDPQAKGHQFFPDTDANAGKLHVVYQDSRTDTATGPSGTAADFGRCPSRINGSSPTHRAVIRVVPVLKHITPPHQTAARTGALYSYQIPPKCRSMSNSATGMCRSLVIIIIFRRSVRLF